MTTDFWDSIDEGRRQWVAHGWVGAAPGMVAVSSVIRVYQIVMVEIDVILRPFGLTFARFEVLRLLAFSRSDGLTMGRLGSLLQVHPASVTNAVGRLESDGLVQRTRNPLDSRSTIAKILPQGHELLAPATNALNEFFETLGDAASLESFSKSTIEFGSRLLQAGSKD